jgi:small subunit ribosomal protein S3
MSKSRKARPRTRKARNDVGQKVHPYGFRLGVINNWKSRWIADKEYPELVQEDIKIRRYLRERLANAALSKIEIERKAKELSVDVHTARPGIVIGRKGSEVDKIRDDLMKMVGHDVSINIIEVPIPDLDAALVARNIAEQISGRVSFRRAMKKAVGNTLRADVDYGFVEARTTFGRIGVKVWIYKGDVTGKREDERSMPASLGSARPSRTRPPRPDRPQAMKAVAVPVVPEVVAAEAPAPAPAPEEAPVVQPEPGTEAAPVVETEAPSAEEATE